MVIGIVGRQIINYGIRQTGKYLTQLHKYDVSIHKGLYGASAGRGVRHGRDAGIFVSQYIKGDDLDGEDEPSTGIPPYKQSKARYRYKRYGSRGSSKRYRPCRPARRPSYKRF